MYKENRNNVNDTQFFIISMGQLCLGIASIGIFCIILIIYKKKMQVQKKQALQKKYIPCILSSQIVN